LPPPATYHQRRIRIRSAAHVETRILIADDLLLVRQGIAAFLKESGFEICGEAANGKEAVEKTLALKPDIVLMDVTMPRMGGFDATENILRASPTTRIILLTIQSLPEMTAKAKTIGARGYVSKGNAAAVLIEAINTVLHGQTYFEATPKQS
jgi:DNA-binding NarL/FixJ family response regulator